MGGKVNEDGSMPSGYEDIYGPRSYEVGSGRFKGEDVVRKKPGSPIFGDVIKILLHKEQWR